MGILAIAGSAWGWTRTGIFLARLLLTLILNLASFIFDALSNASIPAFLAFFSNLTVKSLAWTFHRMNNNTAPSPVLRVVERRVSEIEKTPRNRKQQSRRMLKDTMQESKVLGMSFLTVILTWIIKSATLARRSLIGSMMVAGTKDDIVK